MEDNDSYNKAVQYWSHMYNVGIVVFNNPSSHRDTLKSLVDSVLNTKFISEIECLSIHNVDEKFPFPFTAWLLDGLFGAAVTCDNDPCSESFFINSQVKLLDATYDRSVYEYIKLVQFYLDFLVKISFVPVNQSFSGILIENTNLVSRNLSPLQFCIISEKQRLKYLDILVKVLVENMEIIDSCFISVPWSSDAFDDTLRSKFLKSLQPSSLEMLNLFLPLLNKLIKAFPEKFEHEALIPLFRMLPSLVETNFILHSIRRQEFMNVWNFCITSLHIKNCELEYAIGNLEKIKNNCKLENFVPSELGTLLSKHSDPKVVDSILLKFLPWSFHDKVLLYEPLIASYLLGLHFTDSAIIEVDASCKYWNDLKHQLLEIASNCEVNYGKIKCLHVVASAVTRIVAKLDNQENIWKKNILLQFFQNSFSVVIQCIITHLTGSQNNDISQMSAETLGLFMNLPESRLNDIDNYDWRPKLVEMLSKERLQVNVFEEKSLAAPLLFSLQTVPFGLQGSTCVELFASFLLDMSRGVEIPLQIVNSIPVLFVFGKVSAAQLIADLVLPALLCNNETVQMATLDSLSSLVCAVAGMTLIFRLPSGIKTVKCLECLKVQSNPGGPKNLEQIESHLLKVFESVFKLSSSIRRHFLNLFPKFNLHFSKTLRNQLLPKMLTYLSDDDIGIRRAFADIVVNVIFSNFDVFNPQAIDSATLSALDTFFTKVEEEINAKLSSEQWGESLQCFFTTLNNVACVPVPEVELRSLKLILLFVGNCPLPLSSIASVFAAAHKTSSLALYFAYKPELSQFFGELLIKNQVRYGCPPALTLSSIILFIGLSKVRFASSSEPFMLPILVGAISQQTSVGNILSEYAEYIGVGLPVILTRVFQHIFVNLWLKEDEVAFKKCMAHVENCSSLKISDLILHSQKMIIHQFLFNLHCNQEKVLMGLAKVLNISSSNIAETVASNLESRFVGYLLFLVGKFTKEGSAESEKVQALESLSAVLLLMGKQRVTPVSRKVLATLQTTLSLNRKKHSSLHCKAWSSFVKTMDLKEIGPLLATIVVSLLPMLEHAESEVIGVLSYLLVEQKRAVQEFLPTLSFLPAHPALQKINDGIQAYLSFENEEIKETIIRETSLALHETVEVRIEGLKALQKTLQGSPQEVQSLINGSDDPDPSITSLWEALVTSCQDPDLNIALAAASCLGELGAIDPGLLPRKLKPRGSLPLSVHDTEFGYLALCEIVRGFQNARTSVDMDAFAIGIQELLKIYSVSEASDNITWVRFSPSDHSLLRPMLTSRYKVQVPARTSWPDIIFTAREATSHMLWASLWAGKLIGLCSDARAVVLFRACEPSIKRDPKVLLFFLQYIVLNVVIQDSAAHNVVLKEMEAVMAWSSQDSQPHATSLPISYRLIESFGYPLIRSSISESDARACSMTVFLLIDFLRYWSRSFLTKNLSPTADHLQKKEYVLVKEFLEKIDLVKMAVANYDMQEYPRAIQCWEDVSRSNSDSLMEHLTMLSKSYARYGDLDSVTGARALQGSYPDVQDQLFYHQVSRQIEEVRVLYEQLGKTSEITPSQVEGMVLCYLRLGEPFAAFSHIQHNIGNPPEMSIILTESMSECLTKLGDWSKLDEFLKSENGVIERSWHTQLGRITLGLNSSNLVDVNRDVSEARTVLVQHFTALGLHSGNEHQGYHYLVKLQILNEIEKVRDLLTVKETQDISRVSLKKLLKHWETKQDLVQTDSECMEQILSTRRTLLTLLAAKVPELCKQLLRDELGKCWVNSAEIARKSGCFHQAYNYILSAEAYNIPRTFIEKAQLLWDKGDQEGSLTTLTRGIATHFPDAETMKALPMDERLDERKMTAEAKLLYAVYNEETSNCSSYTNMSNYQDAYDVCRQLEKTQALLAQCLDRGLSLIDEREQGESKACDLRVMMVSNFGKSLLNGCEYVYQSVPRMLSIWLDLGENLSTPERQRAMAKINKLIQIFSEKLPPFILMTALPQLLSRIGHPNREVFLILKSILVSLIRAFPQQCLWAVQTLAKSSVPERSMRYKEVVHDPSLRSTSLFKLIEDFTTLCDKLNRLTNKNLPQDSITKGLMVSNVVRELPLLLNSDNFSKVIVPITKFCAISLPKSVTSSTHQPFPKNPVTIAGIKNEMTVLPSLQRPRKITFLGSDGKHYDILCKPKDDLRRDARLMEFNNIVNMYLHRDPESRARHLHIRTYVVTPLGESGGLLEWVPYLVGLRPALLQLYKQHGKFVSTRELRKHELQSRDPLEKKRTVYLEKLLPMHPPLFHEWFRLTFPDPAGWYAARQAFTRTTAVMSMVGYILGLGDRHGENILFDSESGETVHVDFNCLFNKGENFDWKERVPFRLTHNMTSAMGPCGVECTFRKSCETSMRVLRAQGKTLMSVLTPFAYDPFGSWSKNKEIVHQERDQKIAEALEELSDIEKRLNGSLRVKQKNNTFYLSVEGLVRSLITEATSVDNLCQMYLGWGAYL